MDPLAKNYNFFGNVATYKNRFNFGTSFFLVFLSLLVIYDSQSPRFMENQKMIQAVFYSYTFLLAMAFIISRRAKINKYLFFGIVLSSFGLMKSIVSSHYHFTWIIGDFLLVTSPIMIAISAYYRPNLFINRIFWFMVIIALLASFIAFFFPDISDRNRFEAPSIFIITTISYLLLTSDYKKYRIVTICLYFLIVILAWLSQWRFNFMLTLLCPVFIIALHYGINRVFVISTFLFLAGGSMIFFSGDWITSTIQQSRFAFIYQGGIANDSSLMFRFFEAAAVLQFCIDNWNIFDYIFGGGHGAWFDGRALSTLAYSEYFDDKIYDGQIRVHNIHIGFIAIFFRYGILGIALLIYLLYKIWKYLLRIRDFPIEIRILTSSTFIYFITQLTLYNMSNTILFTFVVGSFLGIYLLTASKVR